jgi:hypothetical protein
MNDSTRSKLAARFARERATEQLDAFAFRVSLCAGTFLSREKSRGQIRSSIVLGDSAESSFNAANLL